MSCVLRPLRGRYDEGELNGGKHGGDPKAQFSLAHGICIRGLLAFARTAAPGSSVSLSADPLFPCLQGSPIPQAFFL